MTSDEGLWGLSRSRTGKARLIAWLALLGLMGCQQPAAEPKPAARSVLSAEGSAFVLRTGDGTVLRGTELTGATVYLAVNDEQVMPVKIASIEPDPQRPDILRHEMEIPDGEGGTRSVCVPNASGETWGFPVTLPEWHPGREHEITLTCASGATVKCARFGYAPWAKGPQGEDLAPVHAACTRMVRADYCGDGISYTKNGTQIDMYDDLGIQAPDSDDQPAFVFEAGWDVSGAVCVNHTRWSDLLTMEELGQRCPKATALPQCNETSARAAGALLFNRSRMLGGDPE